MAVQEDNSSPNWTQFPFTHRTPFTMILLNCSPKDVLSCRSTCSAWHSWFSSSCSIWGKYFVSLSSSVRDASNYRLEKLTSIPFHGEAGALTLSIRLHRALRESTPPLNGETMKLVRILEQSVPVLGPPAVFVRLKVNHPVVAKIVGENLCRYLGAILIDKKDIEKAEVRQCVFMSMHRGQNWAYVNFGQRKKAEQPDEEIVDTSGSLVLEGEHNLEEALRLSMGGRKVEIEKRKRSSDSTDKGRSSKKGKFDIDEEESNKEIEDDCAGVSNSGDSSTRTIYKVEENSSSQFPTIQELLSIDQPLVEELLVERCQIDSSLVVPQFDEFLHHPSLLESSKLLVGCDSEGKVASVKPASFCQGEGGGAVLGYIESPNTVFRNSQQVDFWGGKDIRHKWPEFAKQLDRMDANEAGTSRQKQYGSKLNLPVLAATAPNDSSDDTVGVQSNKEPVAGPSSSSSIGDVMALLAKRGISVQKK